MKHHLQQCLTSSKHWNRLQSSGSKTSRSSKWQRKPTYKSKSIFLSERKKKAFLFKPRINSGLSPQSWGWWGRKAKKPAEKLQSFSQTPKRGFLHTSTAPPVWLLLSYNLQKRFLRWMSDPSKVWSTGATKCTKTLIANSLSSSLQSSSSSSSSCIHSSNTLLSQDPRLLWDNVQKL